MFEPTYAARSAFETRIAECKDLKQFYKHIRSQLSGSVGPLQTRDNSGNIVDNSHAARVFARKIGPVKPPLLLI